jgi:hypothetical protein
MRQRWNTRLHKVRERCRGGGEKEPTLIDTGFSFGKCERAMFVLQPQECSEKKVIQTFNM